MPSIQKYCREMLAALVEICLCKC